MIVSGSGFLVLGLGHGLVHSLVHAQVMVVISKALQGKAVLLSSRPPQSVQSASSACRHIFQKTDMSGTFQQLRGKLRLYLGYLSLNVPDSALRLYVGLRIRGFRYHILAGTFDCRHALAGTNLYCGGLPSSPSRNHSRGLLLHDLMSQW